MAQFVIRRKLDISIKKITFFPQHTWTHYTSVPVFVLVQERNT
jgi:hypothetical protein